MWEASNSIASPAVVDMPGKGALVLSPAITDYLKATSSDSYRLFKDEAAQSLQCYFCYEETEVQNCNQVKNCPEEAKGCRTITHSSNTGYPFVSGEELVTRDCAQSCFQSDPDALGQENRVYCCRGNLCNNLYEVFANKTGHTNHSPGTMKGGLLPGLALLTLRLFV
ncbi:secreted Ly-6/uPAR-related protein 1-like [Hyla sarda]|uniref:secreted Ly-6/uPAR-related protein 1-like n=1 Tax=Hyla sarda TaxID=327740 RepID=UPI0024C46376|nr:secreted Ly-6/uPAR-related protein 1-like [Hyla sarda]